MNSSIRPVSFEQHGQTKISNTTNYDHSKGQQIVPLVAHEFAIASAEMPIVFVKNADTGEFQPVALLGFEQGDNVFFKDGKWLGRYVPALITHHPFALLPSQNDANQLQLIIKEDSPVVNTTEGQLLFDALGNESEYMEKRKNALGQYFEHTHITKIFVKHLVDHDLLTQQDLTLTLNGEQIAINGVYLVDEKKLNELSSDAFIALREKGVLSPIYSHLNSLHQLSNIARLKTL